MRWLLYHAGRRRPDCGGTEVRDSDSALERLVGPAFWALSVLCLLNLNDLARMWIGREGAFVAPMLICCLPGLAGLVHVGPRRALGTPGALILFCLVSYAGIGTVVTTLSGDSPQPHTEWWYLVRHAKAALVVIAAAAGGSVLLRRVGAESVLPGLLTVMTASCILVLASPFLLTIFQLPPTSGAYRFFGSFSDPNDAAFVACLAIVTALALIMGDRFRAFAHGALAVAVAALIGTLSRTGLVVVPVVTLGALLAGRGVQRARVARAAGFAALAVAATLVALGPSAFDERRISRLESVVAIFIGPIAGEMQLPDRVVLWNLGLEQALAAPLVGNGLGRLHALDGAWYNEEGVLLGVHNQYLVLVGEAGFVPLLAYCLFLVMMVQAGFRNGRASWPVAAVGGWAVVLIFFSMTFHTTTLALRASNFIIGLSCALMASGPRDEGPRPEGA